MDWQNFFRISPDVTFWQIIDSQFWTTVLAAAFGILLLRYESKLRDAQDEARAADEALRTREEVDRKETEQEDEGATGSPVPLNGEAVNRRNEAKALVEASKRYIEKQVADDTDLRHQRTYEKISRHYPSDVALALRDRHRITDKQFEAAFALFRKWKKFARGKAANNVVSNADLEEFKRLHGELVKS